MQVDRPVADRAAARQRNGGFSAPRQHRPQHQDRSAHLADHVVWRDGRGDFFRLKGHFAPDFALLDARHRSRDPKLVHEVREIIDVGQPREVRKRQLFIGQKRTGQKRQCAVLGARDRDLAFEALATGDANGVPRRALAAYSAFSSVHWSGCWFSRAKSITWETLVSATSYVNTPQTATPCW